MRWIQAPILLCVTALVIACGKPKFKTSTPEELLDSALEMVATNQARYLPTLLEIPARDVTFDDGVTEASAIDEVRAKAGDMLARMVRVAAVLRERFRPQVDKEVSSALGKGSKASSREMAMAALSNPLEWLKVQRSRVSADDLGDGTAALSFDGQPVLAGAVTLTQTNQGWRVRFPVELARSSKYWPDTREEWAVIASMMLSVENALKDFERDLNNGSIQNLDGASSRVGRMVGESLVVQSIIYAMMNRDEDQQESDDGIVAPSHEKKEAGRDQNG